MEGRAVTDAAAQRQDTGPEATNRTDQEDPGGSFDYFARPQSKDLDTFFSFHPQQPSNVHIPKVFYYKSGANRKWLTYNEKNKHLYCSVCLAFAPFLSEGPFIKGGMKDWTHCHLRVKEHEQSKTHTDSANAYFMRARKGDVKSLLTGNQMSLHAEQVKKKRQVMERVVDVVKVIGKCGLSYRGEEESGYALENVAANHGNSLELRQKERE